MQIAILLCQTADYISSASIQPTIVAAVISSVVAFIGIMVTVVIHRYQKINSIRQEIYKKLNGFYGPMKMLLNESNQLYKLFSVDKKRLKEEDEDRFKTLLFLLKGKRQQLSKTDQELLEKIFKIGFKMELIIEKNMGLIDNEYLFVLVSHLAIHFKIIRMAYEGKIEPNEENVKLFADKTFPKAIADALTMYFDFLKLNLEKYNSKIRKKELKTKYVKTFQKYEKNINKNIKPYLSSIYPSMELHAGLLLVGTPYHHYIEGLHGSGNEK